MDEHCPPTAQFNVVSTAAMHTPLPQWVIRDRDDLVRHLCLSALPQKRPETVLEPHVAKGHVWTAPAVQEESDLSAKRSGAAMYPACFSRRGLPRRDAAAMAAGPDVIR